MLIADSRYAPVDFLLTNIDKVQRKKLSVTHVPWIWLMILRKHFFCVHMKNILEEEHQMIETRSEAWVKKHNTFSEVCEVIFSVSVWLNAVISIAGTELTFCVNVGLSQTFHPKNAKQMKK